MADDTKISDLTAFTTLVATDLLPVVDVANSETKSMTITNFFDGIPVDLGLATGKTLGTDMIDLPEITAPSTPSTNKVRIYNEAIKGFSFLKYYDDTGMKREIIRDSMILVKNVRGTTIAANRIVYATGSEDNIPTVDLARSDSSSTMPAIGVTIESIADDAYGRVMQVGLLENINTNALTEGDVLYVSDSTAGVPTTTIPVTPSLSQEIGTVLVKSATVGAIQIIARGLTGNEFGTLQNTFYIGDGLTGTKSLIFNGVANGTLQWDSDNSNWSFTTGNVGIGKTPSSKLDINLATEDLEIVDAGSAAATEQDWIEVEVGGIQGYIRVYATK